MVIDSSALLAILLKEPELTAFVRAIAYDAVRIVSTASVLETAMVIEGRNRDAGTRALDELLERIAVRTMPFDLAQLDIARTVFKIYGKGRHPAALNFGDCIAYALSKSCGEPLLFKGNDFARTDVIAVNWRAYSAN